MRKIVNIRIMVFLALSLCFGIIASFTFLTGSKAVFYVITSCFIAALCGFSFFDFKRGKKRGLIFSAIFIALFLTGAFSFGSVYVRFSDSKYAGHTVLIEGSIKEVSPTESGNRLVLDDIVINGGIKADFNVTFYEYGDADREIGDKIKANVKLMPNGTYYEGKFNSYALTENIKYVAYVHGGEIEYLGSFPSIFERCNLFLKESLKSGMGTSEFGIAYALLCGESEYMDAEILQNFRNAGVAHIFAVSGLHIGFLAFALNFILSKLKCNKYLSLVIVLLTLVFYSGVCGFTASSVRATIMCAALMFSRALGKKYDGLSALSFAAIIVLIISPTQLLSAGFLLSFGVVCGILLLSRPIASLLKFLPAKVASAVGAVVSAQLFSIPVSLYFFGELSLISVIVNLLFLPVVGAVFVFLFIATVLGGAFGISYITLFIPSYILTALRFLLGAFDLSVFVVGGFTLGAFAFIYYLVFIVCSGVINFGVIAKRICIFVLCLAFAVGVPCVNLINNGAGQITAVGSSGFCGAAITYNGENLLVISKANDAFPVSRLQRAATGSDYTVCILKDSVSDVQRAVTRLNAVVKIAEVRFYCENDGYDDILVKSFPKVKFHRFVNGDTFNFAGNTATVSAKGYALELHGSSVDCVIFADVKSDNTDYGYTLKKSYREMWVVDGTDKFSCTFKVDKLYSFRRSVAYSDAETEGNRTITWV